MNELSDLLASATAGIEPGYFRLSIFGGNPVYRERVYCYELYHQMRLRWPEGCAFVLNGEVDKAAHPKLTELGAAGYKPDLLVHTPGDMAGNHAILEVKSVPAARPGYAKDLRTLNVFRKVVGYARAIYLIYGETLTRDDFDRIISGTAKLGLTEPIEIWLHVAPGEPAFCETILEPRAPRKS
jgi:hypothetical protein